MLVTGKIIGWSATGTPISDEGILNPVVCHQTAFQKDLTRNKVAVWGATLVPRSIPFFETLLDVQEKQRASAFKGSALRERYVFSHGMLRLLLAPYVGICAKSLKFGTHAFGKPYVLGQKKLQFSFSHTGPHMLVAIGTEFDLGVDLEARRSMADQDSLVDQFFSDLEREQYWATIPSMREEAFFNMWTRKEALIKGTGLGLRQPLDTFSVSHDKQARMLPGQYQDWTLRHLRMGDDLVGALAISHPDADLHGGMIDYSHLLVDPKEKNNCA